MFSVAATRVVPLSLKHVCQTRTISSLSSSFIRHTPIYLNLNYKSPEGYRSNLLGSNAITSPKLEISCNSKLEDVKTQSKSIMEPNTTDYAIHTTSVMRKRRIKMKNHKQRKKRRLVRAQKRKLEK